MNCETCKEEILPDQPYMLVRSVFPDKPNEELVLGSMDCFMQWATGMIAHMTIEHLLPEVLGAERAVQEAQENERGDPSLN